MVPHNCTSLCIGSTHLCLHHGQCCHRSADIPGSYNFAIVSHSIRSSIHVPVVSIAVTLYACIFASSRTVSNLHIIFNRAFKTEVRFCLTNDVRNLFEKRNVLPVTKLVEFTGCRYWRVEDISSSSSPSSIKTTQTPQQKRPIRKNFPLSAIC
jgi:hypothetical protein